MSGKFSKYGAEFNRIDGRRAETQLYQIVLDDLLDKLGAGISPYQRVLAEAAATLSVQLRKYQLRLLSGTMTSDAEAKSFISASNSLFRCLHRLNLPVADDIIAERYCGEALAFGDELGAALAPEAQA